MNQAPEYASWFRQGDLRQSFIRVALSWQIWFLFLPIRFLVNWLRFETSPESGFQFTSLAIVMGLLSSGIVLAISKRLFVASPGSSFRTFGFLALSWFSIGFAEGFVTIQILPQGAIRSSQVTALGAQVLVGLLWLPVVAVAALGIALLTVSRTRSNRLKNSLAVKRMLLENGHGYIEQLQTDFAHRLREALSPGITQLRKKLVLLPKELRITSDLRYACQVLSEFSQREIREFNKLQADPRVKADNLDVREIIDDTKYLGSVLAPANPFLSASLFIPMTIIARPDLPFWINILSALVLWVVTDIMLRFNKLVTNRNYFVRVALILLAACISALCVSAVETGLGIPSDKIQVFIVGVSILMLAAGLSYPYRYYFALENRLRTSEAEVFDLLNQVRVTSQELRARFIQVMSAKVEGRLTLVAHLLFKLESENIVATERLETFARINAVLTSISSELKMLSKPPRKQRLSRLINRLASEWAGLLAIDFQMEKAAALLLAQDPRLEHRAKLIIEEAVVAARSQGLAKFVSVTVTAADEVLRQIRVTIADNGRPFRLRPKPAFGNHIFTVISDAWSIKRSKERLTELTVLLGG